MAIKKLAVIRQDSRLACPFGLPISVGCQNAGESIHRMTLLSDVPTEDAGRFTNANRKVYLHHKTGERCPYADKVVDNVPVVHCDFGDTGEGYKDTPVPASPYYARVFNGLANNSGGSIHGLVAYPLNSYWGNIEMQQLFTSMMTSYSGQEERLTKRASSDVFNLEEFYNQFLGGQ